MKRKLIVLSVLILLTFSLTATPPASCQADRCQVAKSVCGGQADMFNLLCKADGGSPMYCFQKFYVDYYKQCMSDNGC